MSKKADIWMPLYVADYLADTQHLSAEQSGGYLHLLMHSWRVGPLPPDPEILRRITRIDVATWSTAWSTLQAFFEKAENGTLVQPRLERERTAWNTRKASSIAKATLAANARHHGIASSTASSNAQALLGSCPSPSPSPKDKNTPALQASEPFKSAWNELCGTLPKVAKITRSRAAKVRVRMSEGMTLEQFRTAVGKCASTPFLRGEGERGFRASFDWLIDNDRSLTKVLEGQYGGPLNGAERSYRKEDYGTKQ